MKKANSKTFATVQVRRDSPAYLTASSAATGEPGNTVNSILRGNLDCYAKARPLILDAMAAIGEALKEPSGGSYESVRNILNRFDIYNEDLDGDRALLRLVQLVEKEIK